MVDPKWEAPCAMCPAHTPAGVLAAAQERAAEQRALARNRCQYRAADSHRQEPCSCPAVSMVPIYHCSRLDCDCADIRQPKAPAAFCGNCPHHSGRDSRIAEPDKIVRLTPCPPCQQSRDSWEYLQHIL